MYKAFLMKRAGKKSKRQNKIFPLLKNKKQKRFFVRYGTFPTALLINRCGLYDG
jgi:hypothetical protein